MYGLPPWAWICFTKTSGTVAALTLRADRDVDLNAAISNSGSSFNLIFDLDVNRDGIGAVVVKQDIATNGGYIKFGSDATYTTGTYIGGDTARMINSGGGDITFYGDVMLGTGSNGTVIGTANGNLTFSGNIDSGNKYEFVSSSKETAPIVKRRVEIVSLSVLIQA
jgi:hypothetical protein